MKKALKVLSLWGMAVILSGCVNVGITINKDKSVDLTSGVKLDYVDMFKMMIEDKETLASINEQYASMVCASTCPESLGENYESCMTSCAAQNALSDNPSDAEIKKILDSLNESGNLNMDSLVDDDAKKEIEEQGYTFDENFDLENYVYELNLKKHVDSIEEIAGEDVSSVNLDELEKDTKLFQKTSNNTYKASLVWSDDSLGSFGEVLPMGDADNLLTFKVTLPNKAISNNATEVSDDGKTLTWDLAKTKNIDFEFAIATNNSSKILNDDIMKYIAIGLMAGGVLAFIGGVIGFIKSSKK